MSEALSEAQRLCIFYSSTLPAARVAELDDAAIDYDTMRKHECAWQCISSAGVTPEQLYARGFVTPSHFRAVGMDAFDLVDIDVARGMVRLFGASEVRSSFVQSAADAVALAGTESARLLDVGVDASLELCAGEPRSALAVLSRQTDPRRVVEETSVQRLLDAGVQKDGLRGVGITLASFSAMRPPPTAQQLALLGFRSGV